VLESGQVLGKRQGTSEASRYQLQKQLGTNAGRQTWLAIDLRTSPAELVIVKLLAFSPQMQWDEFKLFEREAQVLQQLNHPRIPRYRDYFSLDRHIGEGLCWFGLVQECIPGASLRQLLNEGKRFTETQVRKIAKDILEILIYLHELNPPVLHRDIKPSNLIYTENGQIYLVDFGAVQNQAATEGVTFTVVGTTGYAPLEQFWGKTVPASDLYALGATLIHLLTGTAPADLPQRDLRIQFADRVSIDSTFICWIEALTAPDLDRRFSSARLALKSLETGHVLASFSPNSRRPAHSKVFLRTSPHQLKLGIPQQKLSFNKILIFLGVLIKKISVVLVLLPFLLVLILIIFSGLFWTIWVVVWVISSAIDPNSTLSLLGIVQSLFWIIVSLSFGYGVGLPVGKELVRVLTEVKEATLATFGCQYLYLAKDDFEIAWQLSFLRTYHHKGQTSEIKSIKLISQKGIRIQTQGTKSREDYFLGMELTEAEQNWLAQELQNWLTHKI
jgi:serine/threonine protein kinase